LLTSGNLRDAAAGDGMVGGIDLDGDGAGAGIIRQVSARGACRIFFGRAGRVFRILLRRLRRKYC
jgi:hypothetical protein